MSLSIAAASSTPTALLWGAAGLFVLAAFAFAIRRTLPKPPLPALHFRAHSDPGVPKLDSEEIVRTERVIQVWMVADPGTPVMEINDPVNEEARMGESV